LQTKEIQIEEIASQTVRLARIPGCNPHVVPFQTVIK